MEDHCRALLWVLEAGRLGETYNIGGNNELKNMDVVRLICRLLDELRPSSRDKTNNGLQGYEELITFVTDRPGDDLRYAVDASKIQMELDWQPREELESGFRKAVEWYLENKSW